MVWDARVFQKHDMIFVTLYFSNAKSDVRIIWCHNYTPDKSHSRIINCYYYTSRSTYIIDPMEKKKKQLPFKVINFRLARGTERRRILLYRVVGEWGKEKGAMTSPRGRREKGVKERGCLSPKHLVVWFISVIRTLYLYIHTRTCTFGCGGL